MQIQTKRVYEWPGADDGLRVLVDRLWPRGKSHDETKVDHWMKELAPSNDLRRWFGHDPDKWTEFKKRYFAELREKKNTLHDLLDNADHGTLTLLFGARDEQYHNAVALKEYLKRIQSQRKG